MTKATLAYKSGKIVELQETAVRGRKKNLALEKAVSEALKTGDLKDLHAELQNNLEGWSKVKKVLNSHTKKGAKIPPLAVSIMGLYLSKNRGSAWTDARKWLATGNESQARLVLAAFTKVESCDWRKMLKLMDPLFLKATPIPLEVLEVLRHIAVDKEYLAYTMRYVTSRARKSGPANLKVLKKIKWMDLEL
jgi:hypothetical protein